MVSSIGLMVMHHPRGAAPESMAQDTAWNMSRNRIVLNMALNMVRLPFALPEHRRQRPARTAE